MTSFCCSLLFLPPCSYVMRRIRSWPSFLLSFGFLQHERTVRLNDLNSRKCHTYIKKRDKEAKKDEATKDSFVVVTRNVVAGCRLSYLYIHRQTTDDRKRQLNCELTATTSPAHIKKRPGAPRNRTKCMMTTFWSFVLQCRFSRPSVRRTWPYLNSLAFRTL